MWVQLPPPAPTPNPQSVASISSNILQFAWHLKKDGYREQTIERAVRLLKGLSKRTDLADAEGVKGTLARLEWALGTKEVASNILANYYKFLGIPFSKPFYNRVDKVP